METGASIPAASLLCLCVSVLTETLEAAECVHAAMLTGAGLQATLIQILVTGLAGVSWVTFALVRSDTHSVFTTLLTVRLAASALRRPPAPAAHQPVAMATETFRPVVVHFLSPAAHTEPQQQNQAEPGQHYPALTRDKHGLQSAPGPETHPGAALQTVNKEMKCEEPAETGFKT